jgi:hypothetical protein
MSRVAALAPRLPRAGLICALVAVLNGVAWSLLTPPFHVPDENAHVAYVQYLAQTGKLPTRHSASGPFSAEEERTLAALRFYSVIGQRGSRPVLTAAEQREVHALERGSPSRVGPADASNSTNNPPVYYALEAVPYWISPSHDLLDRLALMRVLSALLAGLTVLVAFLFLRELFPGTPWAWPVGALAIAFQPVFGFMSGGVNNDNLLFLGAACVFYALAVAFRRGLTPRRGAWLGAAIALGLLAKANLLGFVPGVAVALAVLIHRAGPEQRRNAWRGAAACVLLAALPVALYVLLDTTVWHRHVFGAEQASATGSASGLIRTSPVSDNLREEVSYIWQLFLPRAPFMQDHIVGTPLWEIWTKGFVGRFGWHDFGFPYWVDLLVSAILVLVAACAVAYLIGSWPRLRTHLGELAAYALMTVGLLGVIGVVSYQNRNLVNGLDTGNSFGQARYLLPLLPLYGAIVVLAARAFGRRFGPTAGAVLVVLAIAHSLFAQLLTVSRFYG